MTLYRRVVWYFKGLREYTKSGYDQANKSFEPTDLDQDCSGKIYLVTGANSGIGKCVATALAMRGGSVHMVCRNRVTAEAARENIVEATKNERVYTHIVNLSEPSEVCTFAREFAASNNRLDVLINNAGCMVPKEIGSSGFEINFATNSLSPFILINFLKPCLDRSDEPRVINVSSGGMLNQKLDVDDPQFLKMAEFDPRMAYAQHKRQQVVMTEVLAEDNPGIFFSVMHPGWADTPAVRSAMPDFYEKMKDKLRTAEQGADTVVWLAISKNALNHPSGLFFQDRVPVATHLPLAWTQSSNSENRAFLSKLNEFLQSVNK